MSSSARASGYDRHITIFSPEGRLYQVEYAFKAISAESITSIALRGKEGAVLISPKKLPDILVDSTTVTHLHGIAPHIGACVTGRVADGLALVHKARSEAAEYEYQYGVSISPEALGRRIGNLNQVATQKAAMRPLGVSIVFAGVEEGGKVEVYRCDPAGYYVGYSGVATGPKANEAMAALERILKNNNNQQEEQVERVYFGETIEETVKMGVKILGESLGAIFKPSELEIGIVCVRDPVFKIFTTKQVESVLDSLRH